MHSTSSALAGKQQIAKAARLFVTLSTLTGLAGAFVHPIMSYFLVDGLALPPMYIGIYMVSVTVSGLVVSQFFGVMADKGTSAKKLYVLASTGVAVAMLVYITSDRFALILATGISFMALGNASIPQMLTVSRQWANTLPEHQQINIAKFNAQIRAGISLSWMIGPPIAFSLLAVLGFSGVFALSCLAAVTGIVFVKTFIPELATNNGTNKANEKARAPASFWYLTTAIMLGSMGNNMYTSALPLYTLKELELPSYTPGVLMGLVAGIEIPVMLLSAKLCNVLKKSSLMLIAYAVGITFYAGIFFSDSLWQLIPLQLLNAVFFGLFAGIGLTLMQEHLPHRIGFTSAVYSNGFKVGVMIGASCTGLIAQFFSFQYAMLGAMGASSLALMFMVLFRLSSSEL